MTQLVLSTCNIISSAPCIIRPSGPEQPTNELQNSLLTNFRTAQSISPPTTFSKRIDSSSTNGISKFTPPAYDSISRDCANYYIPTVNWKACRLLEEQDQYEITVKLFILPEANLANGKKYANDAIQLVLKALNVDYVDLLIVSFPSNESCERYAGPTSVDSTSKSYNDEEKLMTWAALEDLHKRSIVKRLGVADFGVERLTSFLKRVRVRPEVNQISARDCHNVDAALLKLAKTEKIELYTHQDCSDILPRDSLFWLLGNDRGDGDILSKINQSLSGELTEVSPKWVVKYTAVTRERGVIENKGYFALASMAEDR